MPPNIIWVTLDSVRADHTSLTGYDRSTTPHLERIANASDGASFNHCITTGTGTLTSTASTLTGTYPFYHGIRDSRFISEQLTTGPKLLGEAGYRTAGLSRNGYFSSGTGLDRGFDRFEWISASTLTDAVPPSTLAKYLRNIRTHSAGLTLDTSKHATPYLMNEVAKRWLADLRKEEPFFFALHYNEPHRPYYPPIPYLDTYTDSLEMSTEEAASWSMHVHRNLNKLVAEEYDFSDDEMAALEAMYDAEIRYTDEMIGQLFDHVQSLDLGETVFIVTADHGETFGEQGMLGHSSIIDDAIAHVPLVVSGLDEIDHQTDELVQHVDLMQTLVELAGGEPDQFQGVDLRHETRDYAIIQRGEFDFDPFREHNPEFDTSRYHTGPVTGVRTKEYLYRKSPEKAELYELSDDGGDTLVDRPDVVEQLDPVAEEWLRKEPVESSESSALSEDMRRQLRDLGYVE